MIEDKGILKVATALWVQVCLTKRPRCVVCGNYEMLDVHHFWPKGQYAHLRFDVDNGVTLCRYHHQNVALYRDKIIATLGRVWYDRLDAKRKNPPQFFNFNDAFVKKSIPQLSSLPNKYPGICRENVIIIE